MGLKAADSPARVRSEAARIIEIWTRLQDGEWHDAESLCGSEDDQYSQGGIRFLMRKLERDGLTETKYAKAAPGVPYHGWPKLLIRVRPDWKKT